MGERRKKERRREPPKPTEKLSSLQISSDKAVAAKQRQFCKNLVSTVLDDESALSFSKPVRELWDIAVLGDYFEKIKNPMDLGTVKKHVTSGEYVNEETTLFDPNLFRYDLRLVFLNALQYNAKGTDLAKLAAKFLQYIDSEMINLPGQEEESNRENEGATEGVEKEKSDDDEKMEDKEEEEEQKEEEEEDVEMKEQEQELEKLESRLGALQKHKARAEANLAELELVKNVPMSYEENAKLRDEVEQLPWETAKKVVKILRKYVDQALQDSKEEDPEFVTLEFSTIEPKLLRDIEDLIRPDPRVEKERKAIENLNDEIMQTEKKLRKLPQRDSGVKKKPRRRRN